VVIFLSPSISAMIITQQLWAWETNAKVKIVVACVWSTAGCIAFFVTQQTITLLFALIGLVITLFINRLYRNYYASGHMFFVSTFFALIFGAGWGVSFILTESITSITRGLLLLGLVSLIFSAPLGLITLLPTHSYLFRKKWLRPRQPPATSRPRNYYPKVSLHLPCYAEPPEIVCVTLDALSNLSYPNFEVIVVDNNTKDKRLWEPIEEHCIRLGDRFHFYHVDFLEGAKAGALNFALKHTNDDVEVIGVVDA